MACYINRLPIELLMQCFEDDRFDITYLWMTCRNVSRPFRDAVDLSMRDKILSLTQININWPGFEYLDKENCQEKCEFELCLGFDGFQDKAKEIAVFKEEILNDSVFTVEPENPRAGIILMAKWKAAVSRTYLLFRSWPLICYIDRRVHERLELSVGKVTPTI